MATNDESSSTTTLLDQKDMPLWKKELIQRRKNLAKTQTTSPPQNADCSNICSGPISPVKSTSSTFSKGE